MEQGLILAGSSFAIVDLDEAALGFLNMSMLKPLWEEIWIGILGVNCAMGLKRMKKHAWVLSLFWGIMLLTNAVVQGVYEIVALNWSSACLQTYFFLFLGVIAVGVLLPTRKGFLSPI